MIPTHNEHAQQEFISMAAATFSGAYIGSRLDRTRFGRWVNESPTADSFFAALKRVTVLVAVGLLVVFIFCLMTV